MTVECGIPTLHSEHICGWSGRHASSGFLWAPCTVCQQVAKRFLPTPGWAPRALLCHTCGRLAPAPGRATSHQRSFAEAPVSSRKKSWLKVQPTSCKYSGLIYLCLETQASRPDGGQTVEPKLNWIRSLLISPMQLDQSFLNLAVIWGIPGEICITV